MHLTNDQMISSYSYRGEDSVLSSNKTREQWQTKPKCTKTVKSKTLYLNDLSYVGKQARGSAVSWARTVTMKGGYLLQPHLW